MIGMTGIPGGSSGHFKDDGLNQLCMSGQNTAQFVSFDPELQQRYAWARGWATNTEFDSPEDAATFLLDRSPEHQVNVRSYDPRDPKSKDFVPDLISADDVAARVRGLAGYGLYTIINEKVDIHDGGVSGVAFGNVLEFAPDDTPRCVEKDGILRAPRSVGLKILSNVYGFRPNIPANPMQRIEFSVHPLRRGYLGANTIIWETEEYASVPMEADLEWPNNFSRLMGDKTFGLLVADAVGLQVPLTWAVPRTIEPFTFGTPTGIKETWIRTSPHAQTPGLFTTKRGWMDPFKLLQEEDPTGELIAAILRQDGVDAKYSGALITQANGEPYIEGTSGEGDDFMLGKMAPDALPPHVKVAVMGEYAKAYQQLGPVSMEWVSDGDFVWTVQMHKGRTASQGSVIFPGDAETYTDYRTDNGIEGLRALVGQVAGSGRGVRLIGRVGVTSHFGDILRKAQIPSRLEREI